MMRMLALLTVSLTLAGCATAPQPTSRPRVEPLERPGSVTGAAGVSAPLAVTCRGLRVVQSTGLFLQLWRLGATCSAARGL